MSDSTSSSPERENATAHTSTGRSFTRRTWLALNSASLWAAAIPFKTPQLEKSHIRRATRQVAIPVDERAESARDTMRQMAQRAVEVAHAAGAQYADAHLTRTIQHFYGFGVPYFSNDFDEQGLGVRALVNGYWGFAACPTWEPDDVTQMARDAVAQAKTNAKGPPRTVELGTYPTVTGEWATPVAIDPFSVSIEEKADYISYWLDRGRRCITSANINQFTSRLMFMRQERVTANTEGSLVAQTLYESGGKIEVTDFSPQGASVFIEHVDMRGEGWERLLNAKIPEQLLTMRAKLDAKIALSRNVKPSTIGEYTVVCDGATMAALLDKTLGPATQLDRALGYEANASGTSFLSDPLAMAGTYQVTAPNVTITANRSEPGQLATVKWDEEGVATQPFTLVKDGVLVDYQTTREQAAWLAPYYQKHGKPIRSNGCAASQDALTIPIQHMPNLSLDPGTVDQSTEDLIANVPKGLYLANGIVQADFQARGGLLYGELREIQNGRLSRLLTGGAVLFNTERLWKSVVAVGGQKSAMIVPVSQYEIYSKAPTKGQPEQMNSYSVRAVGATLEKQKMINPSKRA